MIIVFNATFQQYFSYVASDEKKGIESHVSRKQ
jgi:hypothetical protein